MKNKNRNKKLKLMERIITVCFIIIIIELMAMAIMKLLRERSIDHVNEFKDLIKVSDGYISVGVSDFHKSKEVEEFTYQYTSSLNKEKQNIIATQSRIAKYDDNMKLVWESTYKSEYDSTFYDVLEESDGYIVVGSFADSLKQIDNNTRVALIAKFDKNGKKVWDKTYEVLSDTEFYKVIKDNDDYVVIGQSIYENMIMGNHTTGGGIIVRYSKDGEELGHNNFGGNKSGIFNDIIKVDDGFIVCGKDAANYGILLKFEKDFSRDEDDNYLISKKVKWQRTYSNTDEKGFTSMALVGDKLYLVGALNVSNEKDDDGKTIFKYDAGMVIYNTSGKYIGKFNLEDEKHHVFNSVLSDGKYLYLSMLVDVDTYSDGGVKKTKLLKYDIENNKIVNEYFFDYNKNYVVNKLLDVGGKYYYIGTANNKCGIRGCDYYNVYGSIEELKDFK